MNEPLVEMAAKQRWYHVGRPWSDIDGLIYAGSEDPHAGTFIADCGGGPDELFFGEEVVRGAAGVVAALICAEHNAAIEEDAARRASDAQVAAADASVRGLLESIAVHSGDPGSQWAARQALATLAARRAPDAQVAGASVEPCPECHHPWAWHLTQIHMVPETCYCERKPDLPESRRELGLRNALEKIADKIEAAAYHRNYRQAAIDIQVITLGALAATPAPQPATPPLDVDRLDRLGQRVIRDLTSLLISSHLGLDYEHARAIAEGFVLGQPDLMAEYARLAEPRSPSPEGGTK